MYRLGTWILALALAAGGGMPTAAQELTARARLMQQGSAIFDEGAGVAAELALTQGVPYRVFTLDAPRRLVVDLREVSFDGVDAAALERAMAVSGMRMGLFRPGWSRIVLDLDAPLALRSAEMRTDASTGEARIAIRLEPVPEAEFAARSGAPEAALWPRTPPPDAAAPKRRQTGDRPLVVVLDPGHGGIDPGAERDGHSEADLMLTFARELREVLAFSGRYEVVLTREEDVFVPLISRISIARAAGADAFLSLHADALAEGRARGASVYTLSDTASDTAAELLAERHDRADLLAGVDLAEQDDVIAGVLMDMARLETEPRSERLAGTLVEGIRAAVGKMHKRAHHYAGFSVLRAPDIPSVLIELGFMSSPKELENLVDPEWRGRFAQGILDALDTWAQADAEESRRLRQ
ncbi:N-acetylmuramoyl-L-alanine amidase [Maritimibacter sp. 55A14]|uniref:N-acetylmuramoyl-L-alanine amidase n=1 Tax=Maritimibacter sp. 55A14 TaxID=2174844 RepID=UPI000D60D747|nr:N-acetylmuramoyl-L-alanine amidase [Maritimibacter sp. 55A14]PWE30455.1 N-acetylmuramoyl-L-alanine amidase [Maritimibacter sp. 55A14]